MRYLGIAQGAGLFTSKATYDFVVPAAVSLLSTAAVWWLSLSLGLYAPDGLIPGIINLLNLLIAFFIAALAAVATFDRPGLDDKMKGEPATMKRKDSKGVVRDHSRVQGSQEQEHGKSLQDRCRISSDTTPKQEEEVAVTK